MCLESVQEPPLEPPLEPLPALEPPLLPAPQPPLPAPEPPPSSAGTPLPAECSKGFQRGFQRFWTYLKLSSRATVHLVSTTNEHHTQHICTPSECLMVTSTYHVCQNGGGFQRSASSGAPQKERTHGTHVAQARCTAGRRRNYLVFACVNAPICVPTILSFRVQKGPYAHAKWCFCVLARKIVDVQNVQFAHATWCICVRVVSCASTQKAPFAYAGMG